MFNGYSRESSCSYLFTISVLTFIIIFFCTIKIIEFPSDEEELFMDLLHRNKTWNRICWITIEENVFVIFVDLVNVEWEVFVILMISMWDEWMTFVNVRMRRKFFEEDDLTENV